MEENEGMIQVLSGKEAFGGDFTFIVGTLRKEMAEKNETVKAVQSALEEAMDFLMNNRDESVEILSEAYGIDAETLRVYLYDKGIEYTQEIEGLEDFVEFMIHQGYLSESMGQKTLVWSE
ncbi:ABC transporter substrate-binding protein [Aduncisulcus paluster]|uniref:ABC transporter substrate-binding protein n=1 Tax=Aduncisulcus paluster TaxID=2918883 RepID=A0ABQ5KG72_9EUKA|nr:ABC transporter substrate-binding protein [Aduncisulcus paluster]